MTQHRQIRARNAHLEEIADRDLPGAREPAPASMPHFGRPAILLEYAVMTAERIEKLATVTTPAERVRIAGELALVNRALDQIEEQVRRAAQEMLKRLPSPRRALPPSREALPNPKRRRTT